MYIVRDVFQAKPGKAKNLVEIFKNTSSLLLGDGVTNIRVFTDIVADYWTVVWEFEVATVNDYFEMLESSDPSHMEAVGKAMDGYMEFVKGGHREIFKIA